MQKLTTRAAGLAAAFWAPLRIIGLIGLMGLIGMAPRASAQHGDDRPKGAMEEFEEVDPYTKGDSALEEKLGYVNVGEFMWVDGKRTSEVQLDMGAIPMLFVETEHFKIGTSLSTYTIPGDPEERDLIKEEIARFKKRLGKMKVPKREVDPWLRMHLFAQRAEELYAKFIEDFAIEASDLKGPHFGNDEKYLVMLCDRKSEFARYVKTVHKSDADHEFRQTTQKFMVWGASYESITASYTDPVAQPFDLMLSCRMVAGLSALFLESYNKNFYKAPRWLGYIIGHYYVRQIDPRWVYSSGYKEGESRQPDDWKWESKVLDMVKNKFFAKLEDMFKWKGYDDLTRLDHMIAWSKWEYLMTKVEGDHKGFLATLVDESEEAEVRLPKAMEKCFELTPAEFDTAWAKWVKKEYKRRK